MVIWINIYYFILKISKFTISLNFKKSLEKLYCLLKVRNLLCLYLKNVEYTWWIKTDLGPFLLWKSLNENLFYKLGLYRLLSHFSRLCKSTSCLVERMNLTWYTSTPVRSNQSTIKAPGVRFLLMRNTLLLKYSYIQLHGNK